MARKRNLSSLTLDFSNIDPEVKGAGFDVRLNVEGAKKSLDGYHDYRVEKVRVNFDEMEWVFKDTFLRTKITFNYTEIFSLIRFSNTADKEKLLIAIKCWMAKELNENSITVTQNKLLNLYSAILSTKCLSSTSDLERMVQESNLIRKDDISIYKNIPVSSNVMQKFITDFVDFLEFYNREEYVDFINVLNGQKNKLKLKKTYRTLPSFKDVLTIKGYLDHWFEEATKSESEELLKYYPLLLWWNLTSIIPMRIVEFLHISRNCFSFKEGRYFISFPRMKYHRIGVNRTELK